MRFGQKNFFKQKALSQWWHMPLTPALGKQRQVPAWSTEQNPGQPELLHRETLSQKNKTTKKVKQKQICSQG